tara:strand:- start:346 stop:681 length:336 start_codon:yes stop_codon:yes gene_type:complete
MAIYRDSVVRIDLTELVSIRSSFLGEEMSQENVEDLASDLKDRLTWDTLYGMVDEAILEYLDKDENHYGEIQPEPGREEYLNQIEKNKKQFKMVDLVSPAWTIQVPVRKNK